MVGGTPRGFPLVPLLLAKWNGAEADAGAEWSGAEVRPFGRGAATVFAAGSRGFAPGGAQILPILYI
jgi:hypothetical protein